MERDFHHLSEIKNIIEALDLAPIINRMVKINGWTENQARTAASQYKNFLFLKKKYGSEYSLPPSEDIDEFWHNHILHTQKYTRDCQIIFGDFLHHHPHHGENGTISQQELEVCFENETQKFYFQEFGEYIYEIRPGSFIQKIIRLLNPTVNKTT